MTEGCGLPAKVKALEEKNKKLQETLDEIAFTDDEGMVHLKHDDILEMKAHIDNLRRGQETAAGFLHITRKQVEDLDSKVNVNTANRMRNTLIFGGVRVNDDEPVIDAVKRFLTNLMNLSPKGHDVLEAEQLGKGYSRIVKGKEINFPPTVRARCSENFAAKVMGSATVLGGKSDEREGFKYFVKRSRPETQRALRDKYAADVKKYRTQNLDAETEAEMTKYHFTATHFVVNNQVVEEEFFPPTFLAMMNLDVNTLNEMQALDMYSSMPKVQKKSKFQAFGLSITSLDEVKLAYMKVRQINIKADHVMAAYRLKDGEVVKQGCAHDREYYGDQEILTALFKAKAVNVAIFVAREYGSIPLGGARFGAIQSVTNEVIRLVSPETMEPPLQRRPPDHPGHLEQKSLAAGEISKEEDQTIINVVNAKVAPQEANLQ